MSATDPETLKALGQVQGQLEGIANLIKESSAATNRRIDDLSASMNRSLTDHGKRITRLEDNERSTAIKSAAIGAAAGATAGIIGQFFGALAKIKTGG
jgi:type II secretory pathway component PulM